MARRQELTDQLKTVFDSFQGTFGHRMLHTNSPPPDEILHLVLDEPVRKTLLG